MFLCFFFGMVVMEMMFRCLLGVRMWWILVRRVLCMLGLKSLKVKLREMVLNEFLFFGSGGVGCMCRLMWFVSFLFLRCCSVMLCMFLEMLMLMIWLFVLMFCVRVVREWFVL